MTISELTVGVTTVAFSKNNKLVDSLKKVGFKKVITNVKGTRFTKEGLINFLNDVDVAIVGLDIIDHSFLQQVPNLKAISKYGVGLDNIDLSACKEYGVEVLHTQGVNKRSVSELTLGNILSLLRNIYVTSNELKKSNWVKDGGMQLSDKTVGIIGIGNIGKDLVALLKPFGCRILVNDIINQDDYCKENGLTYVSKDEIFLESDVISIHTPLTDATKDLINKKVFSMMKPTSVVINTARGGIINLEDLREALITGEIGGAGIDVYNEEPPQSKDLLKIPNLINTPHIGGNAIEAVEAMGYSAIENILLRYKG